MGERQKDNKEKQNNINFKKRRKPHKNMHITMEQKIRLIRKKKNDNHENPQSLRFVSDILEAIQKRGM